MKYLILFIIIFLTTHSQALAQDIKTNIKDVTIYRNGALINRTGTFNISKGTSTFYIKDICTELDPNNIKVGINNKNIKIVSINHEFAIEDDAILVKEIYSKDKKISLLQDSIAYLNSQNKVLNNERDLILKNIHIGGTQNGVSTAELISMSKFYKTELAEIEKKIIFISSKTKDYKDELFTLMQEKSNKQKKMQKKISQVKMVLSSDNSYSNETLSLSYLVFDASWEPFYEVRIDEINKPLDLVYCAHVNQSSTEDWNNVNLTISTGDPSIGNTVPEFISMFLPPIKKTNSNNIWRRPNSNIIYGVVTDNSYEPLPGAAIVENGTKNATITDTEGKFSIEMKNLDNLLTFSFIGYEPKTLAPNENMNIVLEDDVSALEEVVVVGYGTSRGGANESVANVSAAPRKIKYDNVEKALPLDIKESQTSTEFKIDLPYTIPSDGKNYDVKMLTYKVPANYRYSSIPRYSKDVFLMADVADFAQYSLQKGNAYVYLENIYQGECEISPNQVLDTLSISIGRDKDIAINRKDVKDLTSKKILGSTIKVQKGFEITVKNNKYTPIDLEILDQYPLPNYTDIKVDLTNNGGAVVDTKTGKLTWKIHLDSQQKQTLKFSYEVKYPKSYRFTVE